MQRRDILVAKKYVEIFLQQNNITDIYSDQPNNYGIYVNWNNKSITIHGPSSQAWQKAQTQKTNDPNIFNSTKNGFWIGPFSNFSKAFTFAELLRKLLYLQTHEEALLASGHGIIDSPIKIF